MQPSCDWPSGMVRPVTPLEKIRRAFRKPAEAGRLKQALREARAHVYRQQFSKCSLCKAGAFASRHEQDRADAEAWLARYGDLLDSIG